MIVPTIILASESPRRKALLELIGVSCIVQPADVSEDWDGSSDPREAARHLALRKAKHVARQHTDGLVIGADTIVALDGELLGKPRSEAEAQAMLQRLAGRTHSVVTGVAVVDARSGHVAAGTETTRVTFRPLRSSEIARYVATGEPLDKAGAYGIQGKGALLVSRIEGCYPNVVGLPLVRLAQLLSEFGVGLL